ncbi:MAG TPA: HYExAFE family protein [Phycisphaerales bacterium]|jgi:hypothetical protein|nr:HYExAFE family protein [Phycisphaerales bacterium]
MARRHLHYERAFEGFLRARRIPYVAVDEARKSLVPGVMGAAGGDGALKSFDFVIYGIDSCAPGLGLTGNLLVDVKGRRIPPSRSRRATSALLPGRMDSWVTLEDVESLAQWERLFGEGFRAVFLFVYACDAQPPDALFQEVFEDRGTWYALRAVTLSAYRAAMRTRSPKWRTVDIPRRIFEQISTPLTMGWNAMAGDPGPELAALA